MRGDGRIFKRGKVWWMKYYRDGRPITMSCETTVKEVAGNRLREEVQRSKGAQWLDPKARQITVGDLFKDLLDWYVANNKLGWKGKAEKHWLNHLEKHFAHIRAEYFSTTHQREYRKKRTEEGAAIATVNLELALIRRAFKIAFRSEPPKVVRVPYFEIPDPDNARKVFFDTATMDAIRAAAAELGLWQRTVVEMAFTFGWRRGELFGLRVRNVFIMERLLRLDRSKNKEGREVPIPETLAILLDALITGKKKDEYVFPHSADGTHWRNTWKTICEKAGVKAGRDGGFTMHDARRTSARNKSAAGTPERVIMEMQGWKTPAMFRRYAIVDVNEMKRALEQEKRQQDENREKIREKVQHGYSGQVHHA